MRIGLVILPLLFVAVPASAHDFWIQPVRFQVQPGAPLAGTFQVGHGTLRQRWGLGADRILLFADFFGGERRNRKGDLRGREPADFVTRLAPSGVHVLAMQSTYAISNLPAVRFNDYAKEEGLLPAIAARRKARKLNSPGRERYSRRAKALIEVGEQTRSNQAWATLPIGLRLEIVPERNPYGLGPSRKLPLHVLYNGRRLANATVKLTNLESDAKPFAIAVTNRAGRATFRVPPTGGWLLNVVWTEPVKGDSRVDFDTTFSSLTFGYGRARRPR